ncbi:DNA repair protein RecN [Candidatus Caldatribacterium sp.]|uniref:DNA repair protein RecN n=1 Tax=Candidatus Caldatribacterium sp. TaxID=2282143 RepID=UPI002991CF5A|nr:hypothetical protein [Candidatus Caldatribacterium sp.]MDW8080776.1 hypothetical protein [Candidatus Calescibacterium sp.]
MLRSLVIRDFILVEHQEIAFAPGLNVITGETGTGKSLLVNALSLLLGARGREEWIRPGSSRAVVEGYFSLANAQGAKRKIEELGLPLEIGENVVLSRELARGGKGRARINGRVVPLGLLRDIATCLVDICGQREHTSFFTSSNILNVLDLFLSEEGKRVKERYRICFEEKRKLEEALAALERGQEEELREIGEVLEETERLGLTPEKVLAVEEEFERLSQAQRYLDAARTFMEVVLGNEGVLQKLSGLRALFRDLLVDVQDILKQVEAGLEEALRRVQVVARSFFFSPEEVEAIERAIAEIERLKRKYRFFTTSDFVAFLENIAVRRRILEEEIAQKEKLRESLERKAEELFLIGGELSAERRRAFEVLQMRLVEELKTLALPNVTVGLCFQRKACPHAEGIDDVEFCVSFNPGMHVLPVLTVASGGELSRIILALKSIASSLWGTPVLVFDEIDQGVGGVTALGVGDKLKKLARTHQVLCITHLPQIASFADYHLKVEKFYAQERVWVEVTPLVSREARLQEIARMMGDEEKGTPTLEYAEILMRKAQSGTFEVK